MGIFLIMIKFAVPVYVFMYKILLMMKFKSYPEVPFNEDQVPQFSQIQFDR